MQQTLTIRGLVQDQLLAMNSLVQDSCSSQQHPRYPESILTELVLRKRSIRAWAAGLQSKDLKHGIDDRDPISLNPANGTYLDSVARELLIVGV